MKYRWTQILIQKMEWKPSGWGIEMVASINQFSHTRVVNISYHVKVFLLCAVSFPFVIPFWRTSAKDIFCQRSWDANKGQQTTTIAHVEWSTRCETFHTICFERIELLFVVSFCRIGRLPLVRFRKGVLIWQQPGSETRCAQNGRMKEQIETKELSRREILRTRFCPPTFSFFCVCFFAPSRLATIGKSKGSR
jgi:hypothetical protein